MQVFFEIMDTQTFAERIKQAREARGWTQAQLAARIGVSRPTISQWEAGQTDKVKGAHLLAAARALDRDPNWLFSGESRYELPTQELRRLWDRLTDSQKAQMLAELKRQAEHNDALLQELAARD